MNEQPNSQATPERRSHQRLVSQPPRKIETFEDSVALAREIMTRAGNDAARILRTKPPKLREEKTLTGVRIVTVWPDGAETNECVVQRIDDQTSMAG